MAFLGNLIASKAQITADGCRMLSFTDLGLPNVQLKYNLLILYPSFRWTYRRSWMDYP